MSESVFRCPHCGQLFIGSKEDVGAEAECSSCGNAFMLEAMTDGQAKHSSGFMCYLGMYRKFFWFRGRMRRRDFWWAFFFWWVVYFVTLIADYIIWDSPNWCAAIFLLVSLIPLAAAQVRRLHDTNKSGWWMPLILLCPINIVYFVWLATAGDKDQNRFGPPAKMINVGRMEDNCYGQE